MIQSSSRACLRSFPQEGVWKDEPPYWRERGCPVQVFGSNSTQQCLKGRTVYVIGNSVARQAAFNMVAMLGGALVNRENQRDLCPKHDVAWGDSCHQEIGGVRIKYLYVAYMDGYSYDDRGGFPFFRFREVNNSTGDVNGRTGKVLNSSSIYAGTPDAFGENNVTGVDNCTRYPMKKCLMGFFNGTTSEDVLIFTLGMNYMLLNDSYYTEVPPRGVIRIDTKAWLIDSALNFRDNLKATFNGTVFRVTLAQANSLMGPKRSVAAMTPLMRRTDNVLWSVLGSTHVPWYTIDQWAINEGRDFLYNDHIHFNGILTFAMLTQVLNRLCPRKGDYDERNIQWPKPELNGNLVQFINNSNDRLETYYVDNSGYLLDIESCPYIDSKQDCIPWYLKNVSRIPFPFTAKKECSISKKKWLPLLADQSLVRERSSTAVYLVENKTLRMFMTANSLLKRGFNFENITVVHQILHTVPRGPVIS